MDRLTPDNNLKLSSDNEEARQAYVKGTKFMTDSRFEEAEPYLSEAVKLDPAFTEALDHLGIVYRRQEKYEEAEKVYLQSLALNDKNTAAYKNLALVYRDMNRLEDTVKMYAKVHELDPDDPESYYGMGALLQSIGEYEKSSEYFLEAIEIYVEQKESDLVFDALYNQGNNHYALKEYKAALHCFEHANRAYPDDEYLLKRIAEIKEILENSTKEFGDFINSCFKELENKQIALVKDYNLTKYDAFWFNQSDETLQFKNDGKVELEFIVVPVGPWSGESNSWMWAWANDSVTEGLRLKAAKIKELSDITGNDIFNDEAFEADEYMAQQLTAAAVHHLDALGIYIAPYDKLKTFLALIKEK